MRCSATHLGTGFSTENVDEFESSCRGAVIGEVAESANCCSHPLHKAKLKTAATEHMTKLEESPSHIMSPFQDLRIKYAA